MINATHDGLGRIAITFSGDPVGVWITVITISLVMIAVLINLGNVGRAIIEVTIGRRFRANRAQRTRAGPGVRRSASETGFAGKEREGG